MMGASRSVGLAQKAGVALAAAALVVAGLALFPSVSKAQAQLPTWPAFPKEQAAPAARGFTQQQFQAVLCNTPGDEPNCTHQGVEEGSNPAITITSTCNYRFTNRNSLENCRVTFSDNRYTLWFEDDLASREIVAEVILPDGTEIERQRDIANVTVVETDDGEGGTNAEQQVTSAPSSDGCSLVNGDLGKCLASIIGKIGASILLILVSILGLLLGIVGAIFNWTVLVTVFQFSTYFGNSEGLLIAWSVLRDIGNILLLFGFIFIGIQTILNVGHFSVGKALPRLLIFAILINFSLFVSSAIIDVSNVFSSALYTSMDGVNCGTQTGASVPEECTGNGIAGRIQAASGLGTIGDDSGSFEELWGASDGVGMLVVYAGLLVLMIVMMIVFIAAIIMLLFRAITLMILMVISPIGFAASAIPQFEEFSQAWWKKLISQAFFAPVFLLMLFVGLKIMDGANATFNTTGASLTTAFASGGANVGGIFILFFLIIGFVVAALVSASQLGAMGASYATSKASGMVIGGIGALGRNTAGRYMHKQAEKLEKSDSKFARSGMGMMLKSGFAAGGKATFDARNVGVVSAAAKAGHLNLGKGQHGGYEHVLHEKEKELVDFSNTLKNSPAEEAQLEELKKQAKRAREKDHPAALAAMDQAHAGAKAPILEELKQAEEAAKRARQTGDAGAINTAETALNNINAKYARLTEAQAKERKAEEQQHKAFLDNIEKEQKKIKEKPKRDLADNLHREMPVVGPAIKHTVYGDAAHHAHDKILSELDKTAVQKLTAALEGATKATKANTASTHEETDDAHGGGTH